MPQHTERSHYKDLGRLSVPLCFYSFLSPLTVLDIPWLSLYVPFPFKYQASHLFALQRARIIVNTCNIQLSNAVLYSGFTRPVGLLSRWCVCWQGKKKKQKQKSEKFRPPPAAGESMTRSSDECISLCHAHPLFMSSITHCTPIFSVAFMPLAESHP